MNYAYIRVSTADQNIDRQLDAFGAAGIRIDDYYMEKVSAKDANRMELKKLLTIVDEGDTIYVTELSRLARNMIDMCKIAKDLQDRGVQLKSLKENIDLGSAQGVLTMQIFEAVAQFERAIIKERQAEGIKAAKARGKKWGAKKKFDITDPVISGTMEKYYKFEIELDEAYESLGMSQAGFYRYFREWKKANGIQGSRYGTEY